MQDDRQSNVENALIQALKQNEETELLKRVLVNNQIIKHNFKTSVPRELTCAHPGCGKMFEMKLIPFQILYPKYCEDHRSEYRRSLDS